MRNFIYLVQGKAELIKNFFYLEKREDACVLYATYDKYIEGAFFIPNSTWGEGRNYLLNKALELKERFQYFIFIDDDVRFLKGGFEKFEQQLLKYKPSIAVPVFVPKTKATIIEIKVPYWKRSKITFKYQQCKRADAQFIAFHKNVITDCLVVPLQTQFDKISWWFTSSTQQLLILNLYPKSFLQFNNIEVANDLHREYINNEFKRIQLNWLSNQFIKPIKNPRPFASNLLSIKNLKKIYEINRRKIPFKYIEVFIDTVWHTITYKPAVSYYIERKTFLKKIKKKSELWKQHLNGHISKKPIITDFGDGCGSLPKRTKHKGCAASYRGA